MSLLDAPAKLVTVEEYERLGREGYFDDKPRVELLNGIIFTMAPVGWRHQYAISELTNIFLPNAAGRFRISPPGPILLDDWSEPEPDFALVHPSYIKSRRHPVPAETFLVVEVSDSTLRRDRRVKAAAYAKQGLAEYWIVNLVKDQLEVYRNPQSDGYQIREVFALETTIAPLAFPDISVPVGNLFA